MAACRYAELVAQLILIDSGDDVSAFAQPCSSAATHRVRIERREPGLASWVVAEVCADDAEISRHLAGFLGNPWPIPLVTASP